MTLQDYLQKIDEICKKEFMTVNELVHELNIVPYTFMRIKRNPETCSMKTAKKIKRFVDQWESKNLIITH